VQIDIDGRRVGTIPVDVRSSATPGDPAGPAGRVPDQPNRTWRGTVESAVDRWRMDAAGRAEAPAEPVNRVVVHQLAERLPWDGAIAVGVGSVTYWYARLELHRNDRAALRRSARWAARCRARSPKLAPRTGW
jgi:pyruvate dehydrogenase (quinone)